MCLTILALADPPDPKSDLQKAALGPFTAFGALGHVHTHGPVLEERSADPDLGIPLENHRLDEHRFARLAATWLTGDFGY
ncbi:MAG: hypothetical protein ACRDZN_04125 [Acidimicrobiales bacterium]